MVQSENNGLAAQKGSEAICKKVRDGLLLFIYGKFRQEQSNI